MTQKQRQAEDLRVRRTRKLLQEALIELTIEKGFAAITVRNITERAMVNRATFYRHYLDKYDLLDRYMDEVYDLTDSQQGESSPGEKQSQTPDQPPAGLVSLLEHVQSYAGFYRVMLGKKGDPAFVHKIQQYIEKRFRAILPGDVAQANRGTLPLGLCLSYVSHAGVGTIVWWLNHAQSYSPREVAVWINELSKVDLALALQPERVTGI